MHIHYRRQLGNLSNIFGTAAATTTTPAGPATTAILSDPLGGLSSVIASIIATTSPTTSSVAVDASTTPATTPDTTSATPTTIPTTTSTTPTSTLPPTTVEVDVTSTMKASQASASVSPSASATDTPTSHSAVAAAVIGSLVGAFALILLVAFFLRRWNRSRSRVRPRESINFDPNLFRRSAAALKDDESARFTEQKGYLESAAGGAATRAFTPEPRAFSPEYPFQEAQPMYAHGAYSQQQIYSPQPYPTATQQVASEYRGEPLPNDVAEQLHNMPNPHPVTHPGDEDAYGGI
ncbi:hypothetical protein DFH08DRAFT_850422 [Mycena albidolilacea]|uniref:Transmembrane protein n=1 Tax=Mycena albidolilacea TaxID=1033008 RepID=A0AAD7EX42_9AGAR|nr:hypothetical protein DFH08DRAFT_850422 [Mycena albidolilacea]